jgi:hypothetical protein
MAETNTSNAHNSGHERYRFFECHVAFETFAGVSRLGWGFGIHWDALGCLGMSLDALGCLGKNALGTNHNKYLTDQRLCHGVKVY